MLKILPILLLLGCVHMDRATLVTSAASIACDWGQTHAAAARGWVDPSGAMQTEANPIMGTNPSTAKVDAYFLGAEVLNAAIWYVLPKAWKTIYALPVTGMQTFTVYGNTKENLGVCGIR